MHAKWKEEQDQRMQLQASQFASADACRTLRMDTIDAKNAARCADCMHAAMLRRACSSGDMQDEASGPLSPLDICSLCCDCGTDCNRAPASAGAQLAARALVLTGASVAGSLKPM